MKCSRINTYRYIKKDNVYIKERHKMNSYSTKMVNRDDIIEIQFNEGGKNKL